jgi:glyoxylase-like metal-dependent hydrolase (beta-lactamase superfamily II)
VSPSRRSDAGVGITLLPSVHLVGSGAFGISNPYDCHVYLVSDGGQLTLIDAGVGLEPERILANVRSLGFDEASIETIFLTHAHADHAGGTRALQRATGARVVGSEAELGLLAAGDDAALGLDAARRNGTYPADYRYPHFEGGVALADGQTFEVGGLQLTALVVPGHSPGSVCYVLDANGRRVLFAGDTVFSGGFVSVINAPGSDPAAYRHHLPRLGGLDVDALCSGHQPFCLSRGQAHIDLALRRIQLSVIPNLAVAWLPPPPVKAEGS